MHCGGDGVERGREGAASAAPYEEAHQLATEIAEQLVRMEDLGHLAVHHGRIDYPGGTLIRHADTWQPHRA
ncbi:hypothetical protein ABZ569_32365 [Streptomyces albus]|uniref:hypothetical protein n=1 Tax=Streptomyces albus TaxID=1888 RepID=UPI0033CA1D77